MAGPLDSGPSILAHNAADAMFEAGSTAMPARVKRLSRQAANTVAVLARSNLASLPNSRAVPPNVNVFVRGADFGITGTGAFGAEYGRKFHNVFGRPIRIESAPGLFDLWPVRVPVKYDSGHVVGKAYRAVDEVVLNAYADGALDALSDTFDRIGLVG